MSKRDDFIKMMAPLAVEIGARYGLDPRLIIAQSAQETGWGEHAPGGNLFGVKSHGQAGGQSLSTTEYVNGRPVTVTDNFRAYDSVRESMEDYANFLRTNPRYADVFNQSTFEDQAKAVADAGYATDPQYADKIIGIGGNIDLSPYQGADASQAATQVAQSTPPPVPAPPINRMALQAEPASQAPAQPGQMPTVPPNPAMTGMPMQDFPVQLSGGLDPDPRMTAPQTSNLGGGLQPPAPSPGSLQLPDLQTAAFEQAPPMPGPPQQQPGSIGLPPLNTGIATTPPPIPGVGRVTPPEEMAGNVRIPDDQFDALGDRIRLNTPLPPVERELGGFPTLDQMTDFAAPPPLPPAPPPQVDTNLGSFPGFSAMQGFAGTPIDLMNPAPPPVATNPPPLPVPSPVPQQTQQTQHPPAMLDGILGALFSQLPRPTTQSRPQGHSMHSNSSGTPRRGRHTVGHNSLGTSGHRSRYHYIGD